MLWRWPLVLEAMPQLFRVRVLCNFRAGICLGLNDNGTDYKFSIALEINQVYTRLLECVSNGLLNRSSRQYYEVLDILRWRAFVGPADFVIFFRNELRISIS